MVTVQISGSEKEVLCKVYEIPKNQQNENYFEHSK